MSEGYFESCSTFTSRLHPELNDKRPGIFAEPKVPEIHSITMGIRPDEPDIGEVYFGVTLSLILQVLRSRSNMFLLMFLIRIYLEDPFVKNPSKTDLNNKKGLLRRHFFELLSPLLSQVSLIDR